MEDSCIYLVKEREFIKTSEEIIKVGYSDQKNLLRFKKYPKGSLLLCHVYTSNGSVCEKKIISIFKNIFIHRKDIGNEYFEGDYKRMRLIIMEIIRQNEIEKDEGINVYNSIIEDCKKENVVEIKDVYTEKIIEEEEYIKLLPKLSIVIDERKKIRLYAINNALLNESIVENKKILFDNRYNIINYNIYNNIEKFDKILKILDLDYKNICDKISSDLINNNEITIKKILNIDENNVFIELTKLFKIMGYNLKYINEKNILKKDNLLFNELFDSQLIIKKSKFIKEFQKKIDLIMEKENTTDFLISKITLVNKLKNNDDVRSLFKIRKKEITDTRTLLGYFKSLLSQVGLCVKRYQFGDASHRRYTYKLEKMEIIK